MICPHQKFFFTLHPKLEDSKSILEEESRARARLQGELRNVQSELEHARDLLEDEQEGKAELQRQTAKALDEAATWRLKFESGEGGIRSVANTQGLAGMRDERRKKMSCTS